MRLFTRIGDALLGAREPGDDPFVAVEKVIPWDRLADILQEAKGLVRADGPDYLMLAERNHALLRRIGPLFLDAFTFQGAATASGLVQAVELLRTYYAGNRRTLPGNLPTGFVRRSWRSIVMKYSERSTAGSMNSVVCRASRPAPRRGRLGHGQPAVPRVEDQLIAKPLFAAMKEAAPLPVAVPRDSATWLKLRRETLGERLREVADKAGRDQLEDVRISGSSLKITPLQAVTPETAEVLADRLYGLLPRVWITDLPDQVATGPGSATASPICVPICRRMTAGWCSPPYWRMPPTSASHAWPMPVPSPATSSWSGQQVGICGRKPMAVLWPGSSRRNRSSRSPHRSEPGTTSSSDGQNFPLGGRGEAVGAVNPHKGSDPAIGFDTHLSGRYALLTTRSRFSR